jgi:hypothetical protein
MVVPTYLKTNAPWVGYLTLTKTSSGKIQRHRTRLSNAFLQRGRVWSTLSTLVPHTLPLLPGNPNIGRPMHHFLLRQPQSIKNEDKFHTWDSDSSSWYTNPDHDVIMTLSALRTKLPFQLASIHVRAHHDGHCEFNLLPRPAQLNVLADELASEVLADLRAADQPTEFYPLTACRVYLRDGTGHITSCEKRQRTNSISTKSERTFNSATVGRPTSFIPSIGMHIVQQFLHSRIRSAPLLSLSLSPTRPLQPIPAFTIPGDASHQGRRPDHLHCQYSP